MLKNYVQVREWLESFIPLVYGKEELGLSRIQNLLDKLGNPEKKFKSIHVGGTSGKGTTCFYIAEILQGKGFKVGLHVSPHLIYIGERMQIGGKNIPVKRLVGLVNKIKPVIDDIIAKQPEKTPSYFEILVAVSFLYFTQEKVDFAVVEVGLGGRLDATNVLLPEVSVITNVGLDHTEILGNTVEKIAAEKAGIIKTKMPVVTGAGGKALTVIENVAKSKNALLITLDTRQELKVPISDIFGYIRKYYYLFRSTDPSFALQNQNLALMTVFSLGIIPDAKALKKAFSAGFAGRFEQISDGTILDGAHNADKMRALIHFVRNSKLSTSPRNAELRGASKAPNSKQIQKSKIKNLPSIILVVAFKKGKNWKKMIDLLIKNLPVKKVIVAEYQMVTDMGRGSAVKAEEIAKYLSKDKLPDAAKALTGRLTTKVVKNSQEAVFEAVNSLWPLASSRSKDTNGKSPKPNAIVLVTGSLYLVGEARTLWKLPEF